MRFSSQNQIFLFYMELFPHNDPAMDMVDDQLWAGMGYLLLFIGFFLVVFGSIELTVIYSFLKRTTNRVLHRGIPAILLLLGFLLLMRFDASLVIFGSLLLVAPMAALIPPLVIPGSSILNPGSIVS